MRTLQRIVDSPRTEMTIIVLIIINAITLGLETSARVMAEIGPLLTGLDRMLLAIFTVEIAARIAVKRLAFFKDPWSLFDFIVVGIALMPASGTFSILRALRILRVLRLISIIPSLRRVIGGLIAALPGMGSIMLLMALVYYVFSVMATKLFGSAFPDWFGTIGESAYSLFQIMTLESWSMGIARPVIEVYPWAWAFFVPYILCTTFTVLNLFIGIIVSAMQAEHEATAEAERQALHEETEHVVEEVKKLQADIAELKALVEGRKQPGV